MSTAPCRMAHPAAGSAPCPVDRLGSCSSGSVIYVPRLHAGRGQLAGQARPPDGDYRSPFPPPSAVLVVKLLRVSNHEEEKPKVSRDAAVAATTSALVGAIAASYPMLAIPAAVVKDFADPMVEQLLSKIGSLRQQRAQTAIRAAALEADVSVSRLTSTIEESPELLTLMAQVVQSAADTPLDEKIIALGRSLGRGVNDRAVIDAEFVKIRGISAIETFEVKLLEIIGTGEPNRVTAETTDGEPRDNLPGWKRDDIITQHPGFTAVLDALISRLTAEGMVHDRSYQTFGGGGERWALTPFGDECLSLLIAVPAPSQTPSGGSE